MNPIEIISKAFPTDKDLLKFAYLLKQTLLMAGDDGHDTPER